jgi:hypothetical protein
MYQEFTQIQSLDGLENVPKWDSLLLIDIGMRGNAKEMPLET